MIGEERLESYLPKVQLFRQEKTAGQLKNPQPFSKLSLPFSGFFLLSELFQGLCNGFAFGEDDISAVIGYAMQQEKTAINSDEEQEVLQQFVPGSTAGVKVVCFIQMGSHDNLILFSPQPFRQLYRNFMNYFRRGLTGGKRLISLKCFACCSRFIPLLGRYS